MVPMEDALRNAGSMLDGINAVGHRIVHGGSRFVEPVRVDGSVLVELQTIADLAPLQNPAGLGGIAMARRALPHVPHVACFDTAFHATIPPFAYTYGGPYEWLGMGLRRFGFHGFSHQHAATRAAELLARPLHDLRLVSCHLGGGCSLAAVAGGRSVDTTMGFTPLDGLVMATRAGSVDPGLIVHLLRRGASVDELDEILERGSGLLGLSGVSGDVREVIEAREAGNTRAELAIDVFVHRLVTGIGAMAAALGGPDAIVFTGGIGEHNAEIRARAIAACAWIGADIDREANRGVGGDADIATLSASVRVLVVRSREDLVIARATRHLLTTSPPTDDPAAGSQSPLT